MKRLVRKGCKVFTVYIMNDKENDMGDSMKMGNTFWPNLAMKT